ncbi:hypothetical protein BDN72DRAFT_278611 [Pluteus cervinus]|uniref:Uncharacterized protein n=1 Tax=Pluteus cervinus TaxID=181527 RepID=A0ACD3AEY3_9AGAR|nr:hypothetical protein BDN72DRAFT_278611 [Pluteus cervinus]
MWRVGLVVLLKLFFHSLTGCCALNNLSIFPQSRSSLLHPPPPSSYSTRNSPVHTVARFKAKHTCTSHPPTHPPTTLLPSFHHPLRPSPTTPPNPQPTFTSRSIISFFFQYPFDFHRSPLLAQSFSLHSSHRLEKDL